MTPIRIRRAVLVLGVAFAGILIRVGQLAVFERSRHLADREREDRRTEWIPVPRAPIVARGRDGVDRILAEDLPAHDLGFRIEGVDPLDVALREIEAELAVTDGEPEDAGALRDVALAGLSFALPERVRDHLSEALRAGEDRLAEAVSVSRAWAEEEIDRAAQASSGPGSRREGMRVSLQTPAPEDVRLRIRLLAHVPAGAIPAPLAPGIAADPEGGSLLPSRALRSVWIDPLSLWGADWERLLRLDPT
ncbi:MAG: hypothetical protein JXP34_28785, partial [Planctomycetes bacterium]|nr:hypothetical protein [Planctomycetota bacterium]